MTLSGSGKAGGWEVDIDALSDGKSHGVVIRNGGFYLQLGPLEIATIESLLAFLRRPSSEFAYGINGPFAGKVEFFDREGALLLKVADARSSLRTNLVEMIFDVPARRTLAEALGEALEEMQHP